MSFGGPFTPLVLLGSDLFWIAGPVGVGSVVAVVGRLREGWFAGDVAEGLIEAKSLDSRESPKLATSYYVWPISGDKPREAGLE